MSNTGRDTPPGVKDWYELSNNHSGRNPVYECQLQNCWWNNKLCRKRIILSSAISVVLIALSIIAMDLFSVGVIRIAVCFITLFFNLIDSIRDNIRYIHLSMKMDTLIETPDIDKVPSQIEYLQELICRRREILVLEINILHKKFAKKWSEEYEQISKDSVNIS